MRLYFVFQSGTEASTVSVKQWEAVRCIYWDLVFFVFSDMPLCYICRLC